MFLSCVSSRLRNGRFSRLHPFLDRTASSVLLSWASTPSSRFYAFRSTISRVSNYFFRVLLCFPGPDVFLTVSTTLDSRGLARIDYFCPSVELFLWFFAVPVSSHFFIEVSSGIFIGVCRYWIFFIIRIRFAVEEFQLYFIEDSPPLWQ